MHKSLKYICVAAIALYFTIPECIAQSGTYYTVRDFEAWSSVGLKFKIDKKWSLSFEEQLRLRDDASNVDIYFSELGLNYKLDKHFGFGLAGRFIRDNDDQGKIQGYENHFRWNADVLYKHKINRFDLKYRVRYQSKDELGVANTVNDPRTNTVRFKFGADYNFKDWKFDPEFSSEIFKKTESDEGFNKFRLTLGTTYETKKIGDFGVFYRMEKELTGLYPKTTNIAGLKYRYTIKRKKNDK
ncbi:MAG: hypothetical protein ACI8SE_001298 [Bacteroidia bacterium]|jgi:hypothetical protein